MGTSFPHVNPKVVNDMRTFPHVIPNIVNDMRTISYVIPQVVSLSSPIVTHSSPIVLVVGSFPWLLLSLRFLY